MEKILCICGSNVCRSPIMAAILQKLLGDDGFLVESAGADESSGKDLDINPYSALVMKEHGLESATHKSRWAGNLDLNQFTCILCADILAAEWVSARGYNGTIIIPSTGPNPFEKELPAYRIYFETLEKSLGNVAGLIRNEAMM